MSSSTDRRESEMPFQQQPPPPVTNVTSTTLARSPSTRPVHPPDIISFFDPASVGGGGPLKRISTQQRERAELEARERAARIAAGLPAEESLLSRFRSGSLSRRPKPTAIVPLRVDEDHREGLSRSTSHKTLAETPGEEKESGVTIPELEHGEEDHVYPDGGYGWVVVCCCATLAGLTMGWGMNWGVFQTYYAQRVYPGANSAYLSTAGTFAPFMGSLVCFISGRMGDRYGFKRILYLSAGVNWIGLFGAAWATQIWHILLTQGILVGIGMGMAVPLFMSLPSQWFYHKRGLASGIAIGGAGLGGGFSTLMVRPMLDSLGHKYTLIIFSFINSLLIVLATTLIRTRPTAPEAQGSGRGPWVDKVTLKTPRFWSVFISVLIAVLGYAMPYVWMPQWIAVNLPQVPSFQSAIPPTLLGFSVCVGRALSGYVADKLGPMNTYILIYLLSGVVQLTLWLTAKTFAQVCVFAVMYGLIAPGYVGLLPQIIVQVFGPSNLATNVGLLLLANAPGNFISGPAGGALFDASGRTSLAWVIVLGACAQFTGAILAVYARLATEKHLLAKV